MTTFTNATGTKAVRISRNSGDTFTARFVDIYKIGIGDQRNETVLQVLDFGTFGRAKDWAEKKLGL